MPTERLLNPDWTQIVQINAPKHSAGS